MNRLLAPYLFLGAAGLAFFAPPASAQNAASAVANARARGLVGERYDGYLGLAVDGGPQLRHQVQSINIRRRALYVDLATRRGVSLQEVGITAACQLLGTVGVGERYALNDNVWRVRAAGQPVSTPTYCR